MGLAMFIALQRLYLAAYYGWESEGVSMVSTRMGLGEGTERAT